MIVVGRDPNVINFESDSLPLPYEIRSKARKDAFGTFDVNDFGSFDISDEGNWESKSDGRKNKHRCVREYRENFVKKRCPRETNASIEFRAIDSRKAKSGEGGIQRTHFQGVRGKERDRS